MSSQAENPRRWIRNILSSDNNKVSFIARSSSRFSPTILALFILVVFAPFMDKRMSRTAGDDKVYVAQSLEMIRDGNYFVQTLADKPDYRKGPIHYLAVRAGVNVFGLNMWATVWMNLALVIAGAICLGLIVHNHMQHIGGWAFFAGAFLALGMGVYTHVFASQMEAELAGAFCIGMYLLDRAKPGWGDLKFWIFAGIIGWFKSPLHSVLIGLSAMVFWAFIGEFKARLTNWKSWACALIGVAVGFAGYLPYIIYDWQNFYDFYIRRETLDKPPNGSKWHYPVIPFFTYFLAPWTILVIISYIDAFTRLWRRPQLVTRGTKRIFRLGWAIVIPSVLFFILHPYRGQNYNLPVIGGLILVVVSVWATRSRSWQSIYSFGVMLTCAVFLAVPIIISLLVSNFNPMPFWWKSWYPVFVWVATILCIRGVWKYGVTLGQVRPGSMIRRTIWFYWAVGSFMWIIGEREMIDLKLKIQSINASGEPAKVGYYNLHDNVWSEWGYLNFWINYPVEGIHNKERLKQRLNDGYLVLVPGDRYMKDFRAFMQQEMPGAEYDISIWRRWRTKGKAPNGKRLWKDAWDKHDLSIIEKHYYMIRLASK